MRLLRHHLPQSLESLDTDAVRPLRLGPECGQLVLLEEIHTLALALRNFVQRRARYADEAFLDELPLVAVEEGEQQDPDVCSIHICIRHENDAAIAELLGIHRGPADAQPDRRDHGLKLLVLVDLLRFGFLDVEDLSAQRQDGLRLPVPRLLRRARGTVAFHEVELRLPAVAAAAVRQLPRKHGADQNRLSTHHLASGFGGGCRVRSFHALLQDGLKELLIEVEGLVQLFRNDGVHGLPNLRIAEAALRLALELRLGHLDRNDGGQPLPNELAWQRPRVLLDLPNLLAGVVDYPRDHRLDGVHVGAPVTRLDSVREADDHVVVLLLAPLQRDLHLGGVLRAPRYHHRQLVIQWCLPGAQVAEPLLYAPIMLKHLPDPQTGIEVGKLVQPPGNAIPREVDALLEDLRIRQEPDFRSRGTLPSIQVLRNRIFFLLLRHPRCTLLLQVADDLSLLAVQLEQLAVASNRGEGILGERVDHGDANSVKAPADLVARRVSAKLASSMQNRQDRLQGGFARPAVNLPTHNRQDLRARTTIRPGG
eukprot:scaffold1402_cov254-Pinguiococcus_pyrenoidosus.AAC.11